MTPALAGSRLRTTVAAAAAALLALPLLTMPVATAAAAGSPGLGARLGDGAGQVTRLTFSTTLDVASKVEHVLGRHSYGVTILRGTADAAGTTVDLERISVYDYVDGSGPIGGFLTVTWPDGSSVGLRVAGHTVDRGGTARIRGRMKAIAGTGTWAGVRGGGTLRGDRPGPIGTPVTYTFTLALRAA